LLLDLSCRKQGENYKIVTNRWQTYTNEIITHKLLDKLSPYASEFLIHAVDVEGKCNGIELSLIKLLGNWNSIPVTYAGGIHSISDIELINDIGSGNIDFTVGSALDIFGGSKLTYKKMVEQYG